MCFGVLPLSHALLDKPRSVKASSLLQTFIFHVLTLMSQFCLYVPATVPVHTHSRAVVPKLFLVSRLVMISHLSIATFGHGPHLKGLAKRLWISSNRSF